MGPFRVLDVTVALTQKGFVARENDHTFFHFYHDGKDIGVFTKISHGEKEIRAPLAKRMRQQMRLESNADFTRFVDCPLTQAEYVEILRRQGKIA
jgi:hypothetical protein